MAGKDPQIKLLQDLCAQAAALRDSADALCHELTKRMQAEKPQTERRKKPRD